VETRVFAQNLRMTSDSNIHRTDPLRSGPTRVTLTLEKITVAEDNKPAWRRRRAIRLTWHREPGEICGGCARGSDMRVRVVSSQNLIADGKIERPLSHTNQATRTDSNR
jgi:hypothetical protein